jgi:hypothetical protein
MNRDNSGTRVVSSFELRLEMAFVEDLHGALKELLEFTALDSWAVRGEVACYGRGTERIDSWFAIHGAHS